MPATHRYAALTVFGFLALLGGCKTKVTGPSRPRVIPPGVAGTISEYADLIGANEMLVKGYGMVVGLGDGGSSEVPGAIREYLVQDMLKRGIASPRAGAGALSVSRMLKDKDTAVVVIGGQIPPAAPVGTRFDLHVEAPPRTQTTNLDGGYLLPVDLRFALAGRMATFWRSRPWGEGKGSVFVNPFAARAESLAQAKLRSGTVLNGGVVTRERSIRLELRRPSYHIAGLIERLVNERFTTDEDKKVAEAKTSAMVDLHIPPAWRDDYRHFLELVMHLYLVGGPGGNERHARQLARAIVLPTARHEDIALVWEAMGKQVLGVILEHYTSDNQAAAFYAARTGLRLGDAMALDPMIEIAQRPSPFQIAAVEALGDASQFRQVARKIKWMLSSTDELLRVAAYEALLKHGWSSSIRRVAATRHFVLDVVDSDRDYVIYATRTGEPKIVMFGRKIPIRLPVFYSPGDELVTVNASDKDKAVVVYRKLPRGAGNSAPFNVDPLAEQLAKTLAMRAEPGIDGKVQGLGLSYSQVVGVLQGMCQAGHIPARFVLQQPPAIRRIYSAATGVGRPDTPEE